MDICSSHGRIFITTDCQHSLSLFISLSVSLPGGGRNCGVHELICARRGETRFHSANCPNILFFSQPSLKFGAQKVSQIVHRVKLSLRVNYAKEASCLLMIYSARRFCFSHEKSTCKQQQACPTNQPFSVLRYCIYELVKVHFHNQNIPHACCHSDVETLVFVPQQHLI